MWAAVSKPGSWLTGKSMGRPWLGCESPERGHTICDDTSPLTLQTLPVCLCVSVCVCKCLSVYGRSCMCVIPLCKLAPLLFTGLSLGDIQITMGHTHTYKNVTALDAVFYENVLVKVCRVFLNNTVTEQRTPQLREKPLIP